MVPGKGRSRERSVYLSRLVGNTAYAAPVYKTKRPSPEGQAVRFFPEKTLLLSIKAAHDDFPAHGENARYTHSFSFVQFSCPNAARLTSPVHDLPSRSLRPNGCGVLRRTSCCAALRQQTALRGLLRRFRLRRWSRTGLAPVSECRTVRAASNPTRRGQL